MLELNRIYNMDCIEGMKQLDDNSVDAVITDPPYELGFMGKQWDASGIAYNVELWKQVLRVLKPGGYLLAFGGTRTYHRMAVAIEDAGFEIRDMVEWVYGSGFPKSLNIGKAVDKLQGNEREVVGKGNCGYQVAISKIRKEQGYRPNLTNATRETTITKGTSEYEGWGTALKPSHEPICMARKPLAEKTVAENCLKWGTGGINIDESRVGMSQDEIKINYRQGDGKLRDGFVKTKAPEYNPQLGRFPANLIHDNSEEVRECFPESNGMFGGGIRKVKSEILPSIQVKGDCNNDHLKRCDSGNASRFFKSIIYTAKASKSERNAGCEGLEEKQYSHDGREKPIENAYQRNKSVSANNHPTVKPIALMEYLIKMVSKDNAIILDPFIGSGTTAVACKQSNRRFIGFEINAEYVEIANKRLENIPDRLENWIENSSNRSKSVKEK